MLHPYMMVERMMLEIDRVVAGPKPKAADAEVAATDSAKKAAEAAKVNLADVAASQGVPPDKNVTKAHVDAHVAELPPGTGDGAGTGEEDEEEDTGGATP